MVTTSLRQRMLQALSIRNLSARTTRTYISLVSRFALFFHRSPDRLELPEIEQYLFFLRDEKKISYCLFNQTVCALRFFYLHVMERPDLVVRIPYGRREKHYPIVLSVSEMLAILAALRSLRDRVLVTVLYSAGLRLGEVCRLRVENIDSARMLLHIVRARDTRTAMSRFLPSRSNCSVSGGVRPVPPGCCFPAPKTRSIPSITPPSSAPSSSPCAGPASPNASRRVRSVIPSPRT
jgi:integrase